MAFSTASPPSRLSASAALTRSEWTRLPLSPCFLPLKPFFPSPLPLPSRICCSKPSSSGANGYLFPEDHFSELRSSRLERGAPVFVTLPAGSVSPLSGKVSRRKTILASLRALKAAGIEGIVVEVWWGIVERDSPFIYDWDGYLDIVEMASQLRLKVRAIMAFHQCGSGPSDTCWIPLPQWVRQEMDQEPDLAYSDRFGRRNHEYISLGCDVLPVLRGRSPIQTYSDFMKNFRDAFRRFLGDVVTEIQIGMGPAGELRYPSCPSEKLQWAWRNRELGEFQCYDKYMLASLNACLRDIGMHEWGNGGLLGAANLTRDPEDTDFFKSKGTWNTPHGKFFLEWYSRMLLMHGERLCMAAEAIFQGAGVKILAKIAGIHWHYKTKSHPSELTAGYYNTSITDGYLPLLRMLGRYRMTLCCTCFDIQDEEEKRISPSSSPEGLLRQLIFAVRMCGISFVGENSAIRLDDASLAQVIKTSKLCSNGARDSSFSFNFVRMEKSLFDTNNWIRFTRFVRQMSDAKTFQAKLVFGRSESCFSSLSAAKEVKLSFAH